MDVVPDLHRQETQIIPDYTFVPGKMRKEVEGRVQELLRHGPFKESLAALLTTDPNQKNLNVQQLLDMELSPAESIAAVAMLETIIQERWDSGHFVMHCDSSKLDLSRFDGLPVEAYEWMPTKVDPKAFHGGVGKVYLRFPAGLKEEEQSHTHPGARIVVSTGPAKFTSPNIPEGSMDLAAGTVILMPQNMPHNFSAPADQDWQAISFHLPYVGLGEEAMTILAASPEKPTPK